MEVRLLAYFMAVSEIDDYSLANDLNAGLDPHKMTAIQVYDVDYESVTPAQRQAAKQCLFSIIYGGGANTLIEQGIVTTKHQGYALLKQFYKARPGIRALDQLARSTFESRGDVRSYWGRPLYPHTPHKALNYIIQGSGADVMKDAMIRVYDWLEYQAFASHLVLSIHDELVLDCLLSELEILCLALPELMTNTEIERVVELPIDMSIGVTWAAKEDYETPRT